MSVEINKTTSIKIFDSNSIDIDNTNSTEIGNTNSIKISTINDLFELLKSLKPSQLSHLEDFVQPEEGTGIYEMLAPIMGDNLADRTDTYSKTHPCACPHCSGNNITKYGRDRFKKQRYRCASCCRTFTMPSHSPLSFSKKSLAQWFVYMQCMQKGMTIRQSAKIVRISKNTSLYWRHKILNAVKSDLKDNLSGTVEISETLVTESFKGNHSMDRGFHTGRKSRKRGIKRACCTSGTKLRVLCCLDRTHGIFSKVIGKIRPDWQKLKAMLEDKIEAGSTIITNNNMHYIYLAKVLKLEVHKLPNLRNITDTTQNETGEIHNGNAVTFGKKLKTFLVRFNGIATKYLNNYITWLKWDCLREKCAFGFTPMDMFMVTACSSAKLRVCDLKLYTWSA